MFGARYFGRDYFGGSYFGSGNSGPILAPQLSKRYVQFVYFLNYCLRVPKSFYAELVERFIYTASVPAGLGGPMPAIGALPPVAPNQKQTMAIDFGQFLPSGVTLTGTPTVTLSTSFGSDPAADSRVVSGPSIGTVSAALNGSGVVNAAIIFQVANCLPGVNYIVESYCDRSDGDVAEASTRFPCNQPS